jgi:hypothetical protein
VKCRQCHYLLWNLTKPICPECDTGFDFRRYRFAPGSVAFACPHCGERHPGAGAAHHPSDSQDMVCRGCQQSIRVSDMTVHLLADDPDRAIVGLTVAVPWEEPDLGTMQRWWKTMRLAMTDPAELGARMTLSDRLPQALLFTFLTWIITIASAGIVLSLARGDVQAANSIWVQVLFAAVVGGGLTAFVTAILFGPLLALGLRLAGRRVPMHMASSAVLYGQAPMVLIAVVFNLAAHPLVTDTLHSWHGITALIIVGLAILWTLITCIRIGWALPFDDLK